MLKLKKYNKKIANTVGVAPLDDPQTKNISNKCIANVVGADDSVRPHFEELNLKTPKAYSNLISNLQPLTSKTGITLIALIITIIVMLILVGVTINVALNGGLFEKAATAVQKTEKETILEQIIELAEWGNDGKIDVGKTLKNVVDKFGEDKVTPNTVGEETSEVTVKVQGKNGTYNYKISETVIKILDNSGTEGDSSVSSGWVDNGNGTYTKGEKKVAKGAELSSQEVYQMLEISDVGDDKYDGTWSVLGLEGDKLKLISTDNVTDPVYLGDADRMAYEFFDVNYQSSIIKEEVPDYNGYGVSDFDVSVWSYLHAIDTLNSYAVESTGINNARSLTIDDLLALDCFNVTQENVCSASFYWKDSHLYWQLEGRDVMHSNDSYRLRFMCAPWTFGESVVRDLGSKSPRNSPIILVLSHLTAL